MIKAKLSAVQQDFHLLLRPESLEKGDGRSVFHPPYGAVGRPIRISRARARALIAQFLTDGEYHSLSGGLIWLYIAYCEVNNIDYTLQRIARNYYSIKLTKFGEAPVKKDGEPYDYFPGATGEET